VFSVAQREALLEQLVATARSDSSIVAAAVVGSGAIGREDEYSDIDLALRLTPGAGVEVVADAWTELLYREHDAAHHLDIWSRKALYRVFLLKTSLQVDLSFWPDQEFRATGPHFKLLFGSAGEPSDPEVLFPEYLVGMGWLYGLHARSAIARGQLWQAVLMLDGIRDQVIALKCLRHGLSPHQGRGVDELPSDEIHALELARAKDVNEPSLRRSLGASLDALLVEARQHNSELATALRGPIDLLTK